MKVTTDPIKKINQRNIQTETIKKTKNSSTAINSFSKKIEKEKLKQTAILPKISRRTVKN